jgi:hypothetical protein
MIIKMGEKNILMKVNLKEWNSPFYQVMFLKIN